MAPVRQRDPSIERTDEYDEFMKKLEEYHEKRGTTLEPEPKVGNRHLDLLRLYKRVCEEGGYDRVSDTKGNKLAWRRMAAEFCGPGANATTLAFLVKTAYYKNLAAFEISDFHHKEPPPKEILEDVTAKGGDLLNRTLENFNRPLSREVVTLENGQERDSDESEDEEKTPKEDKMDVDEPGSIAGRVTRALRHAPPQRVLFQPEITSARQTRQSSGAMNSPASSGAAQSAHLNGTYGSNGAAATIANYEPRQPVPSAVKPVTTPSNNPEHFRSIRARIEAVRRAARGFPQQKGMMLPGTGFIGPNIYIRALLALQSGLVEEEEYALHHLVKISFERGDKYRFDGFPGLAEALIAKILEVSTLFYGFNWEIAYSEEDAAASGNVLNSLSGTADLLSRLQRLDADVVRDEVEPEQFTRHLRRVIEAGLVLRNMVMLEENALYVARLPLSQDLLTIVLNLPRRAQVTELQHYALEIAEQLTKYWSLDSSSHLYHSLLKQVDSSDRGSIVTALRAISRISMNLEAKNRLDEVPPEILHRVTEWLLVEDEELRNACLDFLYQFTAVTDNVEILVHTINVEGLVSQLSRLLLYNATVNEQRDKARLQQRKEPMPETAPKLSMPIVEQLIALEEPERSSQWLRTCFEEDPMGEITQIALWSAYNAAFNDILTLQQQHKPLMAAKDFITNVSTTFTGAQAQVIPYGTKQKYTIRGIRPRTIPVDPTTRRPYLRCQWHLPPAHQTAGQQTGAQNYVECNEYTGQPKQMWDHILSTHLRLQRDEVGKWQLESKPDVSALNGTPVEKRYTCDWGGCKHFASTKGNPSAYVVGMHIKTHLPDTSPKSGLRNRHNLNSTVSNGSQAQGAPQSVKWHSTATDERNDAAGLPLASVLVLRNLARQMAKLDYPGHSPNFTNGSVKRLREDEDEEDKEGGWVRKVFAPVKDQLFFVMAHNWSLREYMPSLCSAIANGGG